VKPWAQSWALQRKKTMGNECNGMTCLVSGNTKLFLNIKLHTASLKVKVIPAFLPDAELLIFAFPVDQCPVES
jgi:hypothetical protein